MPRLLQANRSGSLVLFEYGAMFHVRCRSGRFIFKALEEVDRAGAVQEVARRLVDEAKRLRAARRQSRPPDKPGSPPSV